MNTIKLADFHGHPIEILDRDGTPWVTGEEIGKALGFAHPRQGINKIYRRYADEFTAEMTVEPNLGSTSGYKEVRIYSPRGAHLIAMFARTDKAKAFRQWVLDVLEKDMDSRLRGNDGADTIAHDTAIMAECNQKMAEVESHYKSQMIAQQQQLIQMTSEAYQLAKEHIGMLKRQATVKRVSITYDMDSTRPDRFIKQVVNTLKLYPNLNKTQLLAECGYSKDDKTARNWLDAFEGEHWFCRKRSGVFTYNLSADALQGELS